MKFARQLERDLVSEWRLKYLDYKAGKKHVKAVAKALWRAYGSPAGGKRSLPPHMSLHHFDGSKQSNWKWGTPAAHGRNGSGKGWVGQVRSDSGAPATEHTGIASSPECGMRYGSIHKRLSVDESSGGFELPDPAIKVPSTTGEGGAEQLAARPCHHPLSCPPRSATLAYSPSKKPPSAAPGPSIWEETRGAAATPRQRIIRMLTAGSPLGRRHSNTKPHAFDEIRQKERELFQFMEDELFKIEAFYRQKEEQATKRLDILREQLEEMRKRRTEDMAESKRKRMKEGGQKSHGNGNGAKVGQPKVTHFSWLQPIASRKKVAPGVRAVPLQNLGCAASKVGSESRDEGRHDFVRRPNDDKVSYRTARRKLKLALQEFYRSLELLRAYALLNRTAFRKLNKKYDKAVNSARPHSFVEDKVNKSWFVTSDVLERHITTVETLYAEYFEHGNPKFAMAKHRDLIKSRRAATRSAFWNGLLFGVGVVFAVQGAVHGAELLFDADPNVRQRTAYLMQLYGGYFLMLYLFILFCLDCYVWERNKVNYPFIFEFDPREHLDWKELAEFGSFFSFLFGVSIWLNFSQFGEWQGMYVYYPVVLIFVTFLVLFFPAPVLHHRARGWFLNAHFRLLLSGLYPVEFRDFFLGDIWCSLTYATQNIELFSCLFANAWQNPVQCNSNHSRLLGFFGALPPVWRVCQCIRRYHDTRNVFPHLVNCGKYTMTILTAVFLSLFRISGTPSNLILFIVFATVNAIYCSIWDLLMDMSLLQRSKNFLLRDVVALKSRWCYYTIMVADPFLRFAWVFYAVFTYDTQHSTLMSFMVAVAEVTRRGAWAIFRVENEHSANVLAYKASRDIPLPYRLEHSVSVDLEAQGLMSGPAIQVGASSSAGRSTGVQIGSRSPAAPATPSAEEEQVADEGTGVRRRMASTFGGGGTGKRSIAQALAQAHRQDFEKRRLSGSASGGCGGTDKDHVIDDDDDDEDDDNDNDDDDNDDDHDNDEHDGKVVNDDLEDILECDHKKEEDSGSGRNGAVEESDEGTRAVGLVNEQTIVGEETGETTSK